MLLKIAITGNIASGKSQVEKFLAKDFPVYDCDQIAHNILDNLEDFYGYDVFTNNKIDRKKLGDLVFKNQDLRKKLETVIHPKVKDKILELFKKHSEDKIIFISVPLLFEAGFEKLFDKILFIKIDKRIQLERLMTRNNFSEEEANARINSQKSQEEKILKADYIIDNSQSLNYLEKQVTNFINNVTK